MTTSFSTRGRWAAISTVALAGVALLGCTRDKAPTLVGLPAQANPAIEAEAIAQPTTGPATVQRLITGEAIRSRPLATAAGGPAKGKRDPRLVPVALFEGSMPTGVTMSVDGQRTFVCFPRWGDAVNFTVAEIARNGTLVAYPDAATNQYLPDEPSRFHPHDHLVSVQSVVVDGRDRLWLLDTGSINFGPVVDGGAKLVGYDLATGRQAATVRFPDGVIKPDSYLNDVRFDLSRGTDGVAYITDSGAGGGIIVVDLSTGESWRKLDGHDSVRAEADFEPTVEGFPMQKQPAGQPPTPVQINSDGIALSPDGKTLYYTPLASRTLYGVPTDALVDRAADPAASVKKIATKPSANDGLACDGYGRVYVTAFETNSIQRLDPVNPGDGRGETVTQDDRLLWPDTLVLNGGYAFVIANQLNRGGDFNDGTDKRTMPFVLFRVPIDAPPGEYR